MSNTVEREAGGCALDEGETGVGQDPPIRRRRRRWIPVAAASTIALILLFVAISTREAIWSGLSGRSPTWSPFVSTKADEKETGDLPDDQDVTPFDTQYAAVERLDDELRKALQNAAKDARKDGIELFINSGWRSKHYQQELLQRKTLESGSRDEALKVVDTPQESAHVSGDGVDIGPPEAADWLIRNGADYGICQVFANERWHFELLAAPGGTCPSLRQDANDDG